MASGPAGTTPTDGNKAARCNAVVAAERADTSQRGEDTLPVLMRPRTRRRAGGTAALLASQSPDATALRFAHDVGCSADANERTRYWNVMSAPHDSGKARQKRPDDDRRIRRQGGNDSPRQHEAKTGHGATTLDRSTAAILWSDPIFGPSDPPRFQREKTSGDIPASRHTAAMVIPARTAAISKSCGVGKFSMARPYNATGCGVNAFFRVARLLSLACVYYAEQYDDTEREGTRHGA